MSYRAHSRAGHDSGGGQVQVRLHKRSDLRIIKCCQAEHEIGDGLLQEEMPVMAVRGELGA